VASDSRCTGKLLCIRRCSGVLEVGGLVASHQEALGRERVGVVGSELDSNLGAAQGSGDGVEWMSGRGISGLVEIRRKYKGSAFCRFDRD
jgi:hypothetical protein